MTLDRLDQILQDTRPADPSPEEFDRLWNGVLARAESEIETEGRDILPMTGFSRDRLKSWGLGLAITAQAAALLIAGLLALRTTPTRPSPNGGPAAVVVQDRDLGTDDSTTLYVTLGTVPGQVLGIDHRSETPEADNDIVSVEKNVLSFMESVDLSDARGAAE